MNTVRSPWWKVDDSISPLGTLTLSCAVALACFSGDLLARELITPDNVPPFWPSTPFLVAILLMVRRKVWPALIVAGLGAAAFLDLSNGRSVSSVAWFVAGNTVEVLIAAWGVSRICKGTPRLNRVKTLATCLAIFWFAALVSAILGAAAMPRGSYALQFRLWFLGDVLGFMTVTPAVLAWSREGPAWSRKARNYLELAALMGGVAACGYAAFLSEERGPRPALLYSFVPLLLWAALRLGVKGVSTAIIVIATMANWGGAHDRGPFAGQGALSNVMSLQLFLLFAGLPFLFLAVLVEERKRAEYATRESEKRFRLVANTAPVMIWMSGVDRLCNYFNRRWLDFTGRSLEEEMGNGWSKGVHPEDLKQCLETYVGAFDRRDSFEMEYRLRRHDGEYCWMFDRGVPRFDSEGGLVGYIGSCIDVTELKLAREALANFGRKLIEAHEQERTKIARELHDDINQRLALAMINLERLKEEIPESAAELKRQFEVEFRRVSELASDVHLMAHRLHSAKLEYLGIEAAAASLCRELGDEQKVPIHFASEDIPRKLPQEIALCLFRVLQEALYNSVQHSGARNIEVSLRRADGRIELRVSDTGKGFDAQRPVNGNGLGLISMKERLRLVNGELTIDTLRPAGTVVCAIVPLEEEVQAGGCDGSGSPQGNHH